MASTMKVTPCAVNALGFNLELPLMPSHGKEDSYMESLASYMVRAFNNTINFH